jgi:hypothetical protein
MGNIMLQRLFGVRPLDLLTFDMPRMRQRRERSLLAAVSRLNMPKPSKFQSTSGRKSTTRFSLTPHSWS